MNPTIDKILKNHMIEEYSEIYYINYENKNSELTYQILNKEDRDFYLRNQDVISMIPMHYLYELIRNKVPCLAHKCFYSGEFDSELCEDLLRKDFKFYHLNPIKEEKIKSFNLSKKNEKISNILTKQINALDGIFLMESDESLFIVNPCSIDFRTSYEELLRSAYSMLIKTEKLKEDGFISTIKDLYDESLNYLYKTNEGKQLREVFKKLLIASKDKELKSLESLTLKFDVLEEIELEICNYEKRTTIYFKIRNNYIGVASVDYLEDKDDFVVHFNLNDLSKILVIDREDEDSLEIFLEKKYEEVFRDETKKLKEKNENQN